MRRPNADITYFADHDVVDLEYPVLRKFALACIEEIVSNEDGIILPGNFGTIRIEGTKKRSVNRKATKELGKLIYHQNYATEGYSFTTKWKFHLRGHIKISSKTRVSLYKLNLYKFKSYITLNKAIQKAILNSKWYNWFRTN